MVWHGESLGHLQCYASCPIFFSDATGKFECTRCGTNSTTTSIFYKHLTRACKEANFACDFCGKVFKVEETLRYHVEVWHQAEKPLICEVCGEGIANEQHMKKHLSRHAQAGTCHFCDAR